MNKSDFHSRSRSTDKPMSIHAAQPIRVRCKFKARALYTRRGCRGIQELVIDVIEISRTQIVVTSDFTSLVPDNFTLVLGERQHGIGCAVYSRVDRQLNCNLIRTESAGMINYLADVRTPEETLGEINHPLFSPSLMMKKLR
jgi:hypothetical protein